MHIYVQTRFILNHYIVVEICVGQEYCLIQTKGRRPKVCIRHYIISISDILEINCSSIALLEKCISQDTEPLQGAYGKI